MGRHSCDWIDDKYIFYVYIGIYLLIREGNLYHSGVIAGDLERQHKGESWL